MATILTATAEPDNDPPRVALSLEWTGETEVTIVRADPDGRSRPVRLAEPAALIGGLWTGYDYESWLGQPATYSATVDATTITSGPVTVAVDAAWLRHPGVPSLSMRVNFEGAGEPVRPIQQTVHEPLGRQHPIVVTDGRRRSARSTLTLRTYDAAEMDQLLGRSTTGRCCCSTCPPRGTTASSTCTWPSGT
ncbi:hypothetical protein [Micromonospora echinospora]|uniref:hypothetical protein n=1 Tax=Micromonospora echinospora TaxID=1877 RepID=UPI003A844DFD